MSDPILWHTSASGCARMPPSPPQPSQRRQSASPVTNERVTRGRPAVSARTVAAILMLTAAAWSAYLPAILIATAAICHPDGHFTQWATNLLQIGDSQ